MSGHRDAPRITGQPNRIPKFDAPVLEALAKLRVAVRAQDEHIGRREHARRDAEVYSRWCEGRRRAVVAINTAREELEELLKESD